MHKPWRGALGAVGVVWALVLGVAAQQLPQQQQVAQTAHFEIHYDTVGTDAVSASFIEAVGQGLEAAYATFVVQDGFRFPAEPVQIHVLGSFLGTNTFGATFVPAQQRRAVIVFNSERVFQSAASFLQETLKLNTSSALFVKSVIAHELFHVIQREYDFTEVLLAESTAVWAAERAVPEADDYVFNSLDFLVGGTDFISLLNLNPSYALGIFWMSVAPELGGAAFIRELLEAARSYDGLDLLEHVFAAHHSTFLDRWAHFAVQLETGQIHDAQVIYLASRALSGQGAPVAALAFDWAGTLRSVRTVDGSSPLLDSPFGSFADPLGSPTRVGHAFGIDYVRIRVVRAGALLLRFQGSPSSEFRVNLVLKRAGRVQRVIELGKDGIAFVPDLQLGDRLTVVITRGVRGTGRYALFLTPGAPLAAGGSGWSLN